MPSLSTRRQVAVAATAAAALALTGVVVANAATTAPAVPAISTTVLTGDVLPDIKKAALLGPTAGDTDVEVGITIARPDPAGEAALERALYRKGSADYHHFLTPSQFDARFGVAQSTYDTVRSWATRDGLTVAASPHSRDYLLLAGTVAQASRTFAVTINNYRDKSGTYYANANAPTVPAGQSITGVIGLNSKLKSQTFNTTPTATTAALPQQDTCVSGTCAGLTTPQDLWSVYDQPGDNYGQGQRMAIFGEGQTDPVITNLRTFEGLHGLPPIPIDVVHADGPDADYSDNSGEVEWDLDTQSSTGMAPRALGETLYFGKNLSDASVLNVFNAWADDPKGPLQASASYGECEENPAGNASEPGYAFSAGVAYTQASEKALVKAVMEGRTLFASTGDTGSSCPVVPVNVNGVGNEAFPVVNYPASSPEVVAVGGTVLYTDTDSAQEKTGFTPSGAKRVQEYSWNYTGGGTSFTFPKPKYQEGINQITGYCVEDDSGAPVTGAVPCRGIPDIAAQSGDVASNGYAIVAGGETAYPGGGTSLSSPLSLGMWTRIQAAAAGSTQNGTTTYPGLGFADTTYYADFASHAADFFDVGGDPKSPPNSNGTYTSTPSWDYLSGLGALDVSAISQHVNGTTAPAHNVLPTYSTGSSGPTLDPCSPVLFVDASGDDAYLGDSSGKGSNPQLDITAGNMTDDGTTLHTTLTINNLTKNPAQTVQGGANDYYFLWTYKNVQYFSEAEVDTTTGAVTYADGTVNGTRFTTAHSDDKGSFNAGKGGTVTVDVPLANIGAPPKGDVLLAPAGQTRVLVGTTATGGFIEQADVGGPKNDYAIGQVCSGSPSPTPSPSVSPSTSPSGAPVPTPSTSPTRTPSKDTTKPAVHVRIVKYHGRQHRRHVIIRVTDAGSGIAYRGHIRVKHGALVRPHSHHARRYPSTRGHLKVRAHRYNHRHKTVVWFTVRDGAGNVRHVHVRF